MTGYPWQTGDELLAHDLNAAIANSIGLSSGTLPLNGSAPMTGPLTLSGNATLPLEAVPLQQLSAATAGVVVPVPAGGSIQAAHDALPATGGSILLAANTVYDITTPIVFSKPNVHISGPTWGTIVRRNASMTSGNLIHSDGANCIIEGFTADANSVTTTNADQWEVVVTGDNSIVRNMQIINSGGSVFLGLSGRNSRATGNTIKGLGIQLSTERGQGIWAFNDQTVMIDHNTISGTNLPAIGADGEGTQIIGNSITNCYFWTSRAGGAIYTGTAAHAPYGTAMVISNNSITLEASTLSQGIEVWMPNTIISGNVIDAVKLQGIVLFASGATITGNTIRNCGVGPNVSGIMVTANISDFVISGNHIYDDRTTPIMRNGISVTAGTSDRYVMTGNLITGIASLLPIDDQGTGTNKTIANNPGSNAYVSGNSTLVGTQQVGVGTGTAVLQLSGGAGQTREFQLFTGSPTAGSSKRFSYGLTGTAEGGSNAGSDFFLATWNDSGGFLLTALTIARATGRTTFGTGFSIFDSVGASNTDLSKHITLHSAGYGVGVTALRLNHIVPTGAGVYFVIGGADRLAVTPTGLGFNGTAAVAKPTVSGAKGSNAALASLLTALAAYGLVTDTTTA